MDLKAILEIRLPTYNRREFLARTLNELLAEDSPVKDIDITVFDNHCTDGSNELIEEVTRTHPNVRHVRNRYNIGGGANIVRCMESSAKEYLWLIADNDDYDWTSWREVESALEQKKDLIVTTNLWNPRTNGVANLFRELTFISSAIWRTSHIDSDVIYNAYNNISCLFPHVALAAKCINEKWDIVYVAKNIVLCGNNVDAGCAKPFTRGTLHAHPYSQYQNFWSAYVTAAQLVEDVQVRSEIIDGISLMQPNPDSPRRFTWGHVDYEMMRINRFLGNDLVKNIYEYYAGLIARQRLAFRFRRMMFVPSWACVDFILSLKPNPILYLKRDASGVKVIAFKYIKFYL